MLLFAIVTDFMYMPQSEVSDWTRSVDSFDNFFLRFEVSPTHSCGKTTVCFNKWLKCDQRKALYLCPSPSPFDVISQITTTKMKLSR